MPETSSVTVYWNASAIFSVLLTFDKRLKEAATGERLCP